MAKVVFSVGENHPLYNKIVEAEIITRNGGYNKRTIEAITKEEVYYPRTKYSGKLQWCVKEIIEDDVPQCFDAHIFDFNSGKIIVETSGETTPYQKGEKFEPFEGVNCKVVCASVINRGVQVVFAVNIDELE